MQTLSKRLKEHYERTFSDFGASSKGVDWGKDEDVLLRYQNMLSVIKPDIGSSSSLLDVGCGYGGLLDYAMQHNVILEYTGIDVAENMIAYAQANNERHVFLLGDVFEHQFDKKYDYVVCNGILTQKLAASIREMDEFANALIRRMFALCEIGIAFNVMTNKVNFMVDNLYYRSPVEMLSFCLDNLSSKVCLDHAYPLYEYTVRVYKQQ